MADLTLHYAVPSRGLVAHWMLEELGEPYTHNVISLEKEEHKTPEFLALNPMGRVPVLNHGDTVVYETGAILSYLADAFPQRQLAPSPDSPLRAEYLKWMFFGPVSVEPAIGWKALGEVTTASDYRPFADVDDVARVLAGAVDGREYIVGDSFTAADVMIGATVMWATTLMPVMPSLPPLQAYWERLSKRPAWQRAWQYDQKVLAAKSDDQINDKSELEKKDLDDGG